MDEPHSALAELEQEAEEGASERTPLILFGNVAVVVAAVVLAVAAVIVLVYYIATRI
jgi:hypothetical protein